MLVSFYRSIDNDQAGSMMRWAVLSLKLGSVSACCLPFHTIGKKTAIIVTLSLSHFTPTLPKEIGTVIIGTKSI